jgi:hypothetical protein
MSPPDGKTDTIIGSEVPWKSMEQKLCMQGLKQKGHGKELLSRDTISNFIFDDTLYTESFLSDAEDDMKEVYIPEIEAFIGPWKLKYQSSFRRNGYPVNIQDVLCGIVISIGSPF